MSKITAFMMLFLIFNSNPTIATTNGKYFNRAIFVVFENENYSSALQQVFFNKLAQSGANFSNFMSISHPSQGNYFALTSGSLNNVYNDNLVNLNVLNIIDLLEAKGLTWKVYAEDYPGNCFLGATNASYARKHNPFISYLNIQKNSTRCSNIVNAKSFDQDAQNDSLANYVFYIPNNKNNGHDTSITYADKWYEQKFSNYVSNSQFMKNTILITTFDESNFSSTNQIYTSIVGPSVQAGVITKTLTLYSLLNLLEDNWNLGDLAKSDVTAPTIPNIWK